MARPRPLWTCPPEWQGETGFIIAGGPSVATQNVAALKGRRVIVVNSSYLVAPWADFLCFGDARWWGEHQNRAPEIFQGRIVSCCDSVLGDPDILNMQKVNVPPGLAEDRQGLAMGRTSLQAAMNLAYHLGVSRMVLLGADMQAAPDGKTHHHEPHIWPQKRGCWDEQMKYLVYARDFLREKNIEVINTSPVSRITWWPHKTLEECL